MVVPHRWSSVLAALTFIGALCLGPNWAYGSTNAAPAPGTIFIAGYTLDQSAEAVVAYPPTGDPYEIPVYPDKLYGTTVDRYGNVYVCDRYRIIEVHADGSPNTFTDASGPDDVVVDAAGDLFAVNGNHGDGIYNVTEYPAGGGPSHLVGDFRYPRQIAMDSSGDLYVNDSLGLWKLHPDGTDQTRLGGRAFAYSSGIAVAPNGDVYVADYVNDVIRVVPADGSPRFAISGLTGPESPVFTADGSLLVIEGGMHRVVRMDPDGSNRTVVIDNITGWDLAVYTPTVVPQTLTFTSVPPTRPHPGDTYLATATGSGSANPIVFSATAGSAGVCTVASSGSVQFTGPGVCVVVARQRGDSTHERAVARQRIRVG